MSKPARLAKRTRRPAASKKTAVAKKKVVSKSKRVAKAGNVDRYVQQLPSPMQQIVNRVRGLVATASPEAIEAFKWSQPVYEANGPFAYIKAHSNHVNFGFWRGALLDAPKGMLEGDGDRMRHIKLTGIGDIDDQVLKLLVQQAVLLNSRLGNPTRR